jgi:hypothetical protein
MTENEASVRLEVIRAGLLSGTDVKVVSSEENIKSIDAAIDAIEENQQYRAIGTPEELQTMKEHGGFTGVELANIAAMQMKLKEYEAIGTPEECREAVEKQTDEKPTAVLGTFGGTEYECKNCGSDVCYGDEYCRWCGQKLDWSDEDEKI